MGRLKSACSRNYLTSHHRDFLLSLARAEPAWEWMPFDKLQHLPALRRKLMNLRRLKERDAGRFLAQYNDLEAKFSEYSCSAYSPTRLGRSALTNGAKKGRLQSRSPVQLTATLDE